MFSSKNIICLDVEMGNSITSAEQFNISIVSANLADFNFRFETDITLLYSCNTGEFEPIDKENLLAEGFATELKNYWHLQTHRQITAKSILKDTLTAVKVR